MKLSEQMKPVARSVRVWTAGVLGIGAALLISGCAFNQTEHWRMTEAVAPSAVKQSENAPTEAVRAVFFRDEGSALRNDQPINLYINGHYQASLVGNTYTEQQLCPGKHRVAVHFNDVYRRYVTKLEGIPLNLGGNPVQYFRVSEDAAGNAVFQPVDVGAEAAGNLRQLQSHTVPRVVRNGCGNA